MRHSSSNLNMLLLGYIKQRRACRMVKGTVLSGHLSLDTFFKFCICRRHRELDSQNMKQFVDERQKVRLSFKKVLKIYKVFH